MIGLVPKTQLQQLFTANNWIKIRDKWKEVPVAQVSSGLGPTSAPVADLTGVYEGL